MAHSRNVVQCLCDQSVRTCDGQLATHLKRLPPEGVRLAAIGGRTKDSAGTRNATTLVGQEGNCATQRRWRAGEERVSAPQQEE
eukprot:1091552-Prymnesium_polylepis.1